MIYINTSVSATYAHSSQFGQTYNKSKFFSHIKKMMQKYEF